MVPSILPVVPLPHFQKKLTKLNDLITATVLLCESLETRSLTPRESATLQQLITFPVEKEVGTRFYPPLSHSERC